MIEALFINEKPSVSREFKTALKLQENGKHTGYFEGFSPVLNCNVQITWCVGHLITLSYPEKYDPALKDWNVEDLPFLPKKYLYEVIPSVKDQFKVVKSLINNMSNNSTIYYAGDPAREGIYIQALVRKASGINANVVEKVVWIDSQTEEEIQKGIKNAKPFSDFKSLIDAGYERAIEDYATGINLSRILSIKYGQKANAYAGLSKYQPVSVGRVMTCVLGMVVDREREIENFVVTPFYKVENKINGIEAEWKAIKGSKMFESALLYNDTGFKEEKDALNFINSLPSSVLIESIERKTERKLAPNLFNLAELQSECTKKYKISPNETLEVAQTLYEAKLTTYPRTDARVLSSAIAKEINKNLQGIASHYESELSGYAENIINGGRWKGIGSTRYTDDSKIADHYAIIPTGMGYENYSKLTNIQKNVYELIVRRFLSIFMPPAEYLVVKLTEDAGGEKFYASTKALQTPGYLEVAGYKNDNEEVDITIFDSLTEGAMYDADYYTKKGETTPPKRYTSGSMILAMENAGNLIEDEALRAQIKGSGIGTSATRAEVINKLVKQQFIYQNSKTQVLTPAPFGNITYEIVSDTIPELLNPRMTALWEKGLDGIATNRINPVDYRTKLEQFVTNAVKLIKQKNNENEIDKKLEPFKVGDLFISKDLSVACPICGGKIKTTQKGCICSNYKKEPSVSELQSHTACKFAIWKIADKVLSIPEMESLISEGITEEIKGFISKAGKKFDAKLKMDIENNNGIEEAKISFVFQGPEKSNLECPNCGEKLLKTKWSYECDCGYKITHFVARKDISETQVKKLIEDGKTDLITGFKKKDGKSFDAYLVKQDDNTVKFEFPKR